MLVERLTAPMQAMGVAFSASLFGVLGSLIMGVLLVAVRNCTGELVSLLDTRTTFPDRLRRRRGQCRRHP